MMDFDQRVDRLLQVHPLYSGFVAHLKRTARKDLTGCSLFDRLSKVETLRRSYGMDLEHPKIEQLLERIRQTGVSAATLNSYRFVLKLWLAYINIEPSTKDRQALRSKSGKRKRKISRVDLLTKDERSLIMSTIQSPSIRAYLAVLYDTGARPSEVARMSVIDVIEDRHGFVLQLHQTKGTQKKRPVRMLDPDSIAAFSAWWAIHPRRDQQDANLFTGRGGRLNVRSLAKYLGERFNEQMNRGPGRAKCALSLYLFRKSRATELLKEGLLSETEIKVRMGHARHSNMLHEYYAVLDEIDQAEAELKYLGIVQEGDRPDVKRPCPNCGAPNSTTESRCFRCRQPLTEREMIEEQKESLRDALRDLLEDPATLQAIADAVASTIQDGEEDGPRPPRRVKP